LQALAVGRGLPNGLTFANPPLYKYVLLAEYGVAFGFERTVGTTRSAQEFIDQFRADPSRLYLIARVTSAVFGALTVLATGALGNAVGGHRVGVVAGGLASVTFLLVRESHFGVDDALMTLLVTAGLIFCLRPNYLLAGAFAGLAFAAKYDGIALLVPLLLARRPDRGVAIRILACAAAALLAFPSLITEPARVIGDVYVHDVLEATTGYDGLDPSGGYIFYARALSTGLGWPLLLASLAGLALAVKRRHRASLIVALLPITILVVLGSQKLYFARFALPAAPALLVLAALALDALLTWRVIIGLAVVAIVGVPTLADSIRFDNLLTQTDTRTLAREWIASNLAPDAAVVAEAPPLGPTLDRPDTTVANDFSLYDRSLADYAERGVEYIVESSFTAEARAVDAQREARRVAFNAVLVQRATLVAEFKPYSGTNGPPFASDQIYGPWTALDELSRPGPTIRVYRLTR
jgi:hypothetical protein